MSPPIPVLWFDADGDGPDYLALELHPFPAEEFAGSRIPAFLGLRIRGAGQAVGTLAAGLLVDSGFNLDRASVGDLHRQLGEWLEATKTESA